MPAPLPTEVRRALAAVLVARTGLNAGLRVVYPFLPAIARGLGTSLQVLGVILAARSLVGLLAPAAARLAETTGRRAVMQAGLASVAVGSAVAGLAPAGRPGVVVVAVGFLVVGFGKPGFDVPMQGWFGARVPFAQRGRVLGTTELTWAGGLLVSVPLSGWLIERTSWRAPFALVVVLCVAGLVAVGRLIPSDRPPHRERRPLRLTRARVAMLACVYLFATAAESLFVVYGAWLEDDLGLSVTGIGLFTLLVAVSEAGGEGLVALIGDRVGLRRLVLGGLLVSAVAYASLGLVGAVLAAAMAAVVVWFVAFEVTIVGSVPFVTELGGEGRDRLLGLMVGTFSAARATGAVTGPALFAAGGITATGAVAAACVLVAAVVLGTLVHLPAAPGATAPPVRLSPPEPRRRLRPRCPPDARPPPG